jgi:hypothetical protein
MEDMAAHLEKLRIDAEDCRACQQTRYRMQKRAIRNSSPNT